MPRSKCWARTALPPVRCKIIPENFPPRCNTAAVFAFLIQNKDHSNKAQEKIHREIHTRNNFQKSLRGGVDNPSAFLYNNTCILAAATVERCPSGLWNWS